jgi:lipopolysaccharide export system permease protein
MLNEKVAPQSTLMAKEHIQNALVKRGITQQRTDISYMDQDAGWLFAAAGGEGNKFYNVKWWDFSRPGMITLYTADEGIWQEDQWVFHNAKVIYLTVSDSQGAGESPAPEGGNVVRTLTSQNLEMHIRRTPTDILASTRRDPEEMSLQELYAYLTSSEAQQKTEAYRRKIWATFHLKISAPFASIIFVLLAAPLSLSAQRSSSAMGTGLSMLLVFFYYMMTTFAVKVAEGNILPPVLAAWTPNIVFLLAGLYLNATLYMKKN